MPDWTGSRTREDALRVPCTHCRARAGEPCVNEITGRELWHFAAHAVRIKDAEKTP